MQSADLAATPGAVAGDSMLVADNHISLSQRAARLEKVIETTTGKKNCQIRPCFSFFFDGTGNNLEADRSTKELSNVAKLFLSHLESDPINGTHRFYIPGIGTYFKEIGDPGGTITGLAFGAEGEQRLEWAFAQFKEKLAAAEALTNNPANKIIEVRIAAFGFSRGATLARAFARRFQKLCFRSDSG